MANKLDELQSQLNKWRVANFGPPNSMHQFLGVVEEVGELAHTKLKFDQGIRGYDKERATKEIRDSIGDVVIFLMGFCDVEGWSLFDIVKETSKEVLQRDWKKNKINGVTK
jgi:NTP pyrophosphatase (non-canonical NTP hydrolase)